MKLIKRLNNAIDTAKASSRSSSFGKNDLVIRHGLMPVVDILKGKKLKIGNEKGNSKIWGLYAGNIFYQCNNEKSAVQSLFHYETYAQFMKKYGSENFPIRINSIYGEYWHTFEKFAKNKKKFAENKKLFDNNMSDRTGGSSKAMEANKLWEIRKDQINDKYGDILNFMLDSSFVPKNTKEDIKNIDPELAKRVVLARDVIRGRHWDGLDAKIKEFFETFPNPLQKTLFDMFKNWGPREDVSAIEDYLRAAPKSRYFSVNKGFSDSDKLNDYIKPSSDIDKLMIYKLFGKL